MTPTRLSLFLAGCLLAANFQLHAAAPEDAARWSLGAVVDTRTADGNGAPVLAVTPGGAAERLGLRPGDRLLAVNGRALLDANAADALAEAVQSGNGALRLDVGRNGRRLALSGTADRDPLANGVDACGRVTTSGAPPRISENVYPARIYDIDGAGTPLGSTHELQAGTHVLLVEEGIDRHRFDAMQAKRRDRTRARLGPRAAKVLVIEVVADTRYAIGARLLPDRLDAAGIHSNRYWEPVVWEVTPEPCRR